MARVRDNAQHRDNAFPPPFTSNDAAPDWAGTIEADLDRELTRTTSAPLQEVVQTAAPRSNAKPLRTALLAVCDNLERRTREWRGAAKIAEQNLRQLIAAETARTDALQALAEAQAAVARTGGDVTSALASFDETDETKNIDPLFGLSEAALEHLERVTSDLSIAQQWCRSAWRAYADSVDREQTMRLHIQAADWAA